jgi:hypothetical protein
MVIKPLGSLIDMNESGDWLPENLQRMLPQSAPKSFPAMDDTMRILMRLGGILIFLAPVSVWCGTIPVFTFSSGLAEICINDSSPAGVTCSAVGGSANLGLVANPTLLPGVVSFTSGGSAFTYTQIDGNLGYLDLDWTGALSQPGYGGTELPFQYSFTVTEDAIQPLLWNITFGPLGVVGFESQSASLIDGGSSTTVTGQGMAFSENADSPDLIDLGLGIQFANLFQGVVPTSGLVPNGDEFTVSDVSVSTDIPAGLFIPEPASWALIFAILPAFYVAYRRRSRE